MKITEEQVYETAKELLVRGATQMPVPVMRALLLAFQHERQVSARATLSAIIENCLAAAEQRASICQDIGIPSFTLTLGRSAPFDADLGQALAQAVRAATQDVPLRANLVFPLTSENSGDNTGWGSPALRIHWGGEDVPADGLKLRAELKGFGGEIKSGLDWVFTSTRNMEDAILAYTLINVMWSKGEACNPGFVGIGVGGYADDAMHWAKDAAFRSLARWGAATPFEERLFRCLNRMGLGPMGSGGDTTTLGVFADIRGCHTACTPVAILHQCWSSRGSEAILTAAGPQYGTEHLTAERARLLRREWEALKERGDGERRGRIFRWRTPVPREEVLKLRVGDLVYLTGTLCTGRDRAHRRMVEYLQAGREGEIPEELRSHRTLYHCGPVTCCVEGEWKVTSAGPTTSSRFTQDGAYVVERGLVDLVVGKGTMGGAMERALKGRGAYLKAVGGCAVSYGNAIHKVSQRWGDLGPPEAVWTFEVKDFGPVVVGIDPTGESLTNRVLEDVFENLLRLYHEEGLDPKTRYAQNPNTFAGLSLEEAIDVHRKGYF